MPLYTFKKNQEGSCEDGVNSFEEQSQPSYLKLLLGQWGDRMGRGLFRYDVTSCETKIIEGKYGFIAQLNEGRHLKKRPTEFRVDQVLQPFDDTKFNFTKVGHEEVLFRFELGNDCNSHFYPDAAAVVESCHPPNIIAINVSIDSIFISISFLCRE